MSNFLKKIVYLIIGLILFIGVFTLGIYVGFSNRPEIDKITGVNNKENPPILQVKADFFPFWKVWNVINDKNPGMIDFLEETGSAGLGGTAVKSYRTLGGESYKAEMGTPAYAALEKIKGGSYKAEMGTPAMEVGTPATAEMKTYK